MLNAPVSPIPSIEISFAPIQLPPVEPKSPFVAQVFADLDSPRSTHLLPPPSASPLRPSHQLSPLSSSSRDGEGMDKSRFEALLKSAKERSAVAAAKKPLELRKELAMKAQKAKQFERRARFLSKLVAPPSPTAAEQPVTPPESPAIFHFSLPSPGLMSPLELFEELALQEEEDGMCKNVRIEQVDFKIPGGYTKVRKARPSAGIKVPSLDDITKRLNIASPLSTDATTVRNAGGSTRLPSFLRARSPAQVASPAPTPSLITVQSPVPVNAARHSSLLPPPTPEPGSRPTLQVTTIICPPTRSKGSPTEFTAQNVARLPERRSSITSIPAADEAVPSNRAQASKDLLRTLGKRTPGLPGISASDDTSPVLCLSTGELNMVRRRRSAPAEVPAAQRRQRHPVQDLPGGF